jgi:putative ABC transport system ATP-binding protein
MKIELKGVFKSFQEGRQTQSILSNINIGFESQKFTAILGKSGSGKSTLLNMISGIDTPDRGIIQLDQTDINGLSDYKRTILRRHKIGIVFQFFNLISTLTVLENVTLVSELTGGSKTQIKKRAVILLDHLGLKEKLHVMPDILSGGEQQRVAIARALAHEPELILADEPTGNLDNKTAQLVMNQFLTLIKEHNKTLIMATHSLDAAKLADRIVTIKNNQLVEGN